MSNQRAALLVRLIHQGNGKLSKAKRSGFTELTNQEIEEMETAIEQAFPGSPGAGRYRTPLTNILNS
jgi:hypothetical protein